MPQAYARYSSIRNFGIMAVEFVVLSGCALLGYEIRFGKDLTWVWHGEQPLLKILPIVLAFQLTGYFVDVYEFRAGATESLRRRLITIGAALALVFVLQWVLPELFPGRGVLVIALTLMSLVFYMWHASLRLYVGRASRSSVLVLGTNRLAQDLVREILKRPEMRLKVQGFLTTEPALVGSRLVNPGVVGLTADLGRLVDELDVKSVVVALSDRRGVLPSSELLSLKCRGVSVEDGTSIYERVTGKIALENLKPSWLIFNEGFDLSTRTLIGKDIFSFVASVGMLLLTSPLLVLAAIAIKLDSPGPVFFKQQRVGRNGQTFVLWKFRSMREDAEDDTGPIWAALGDPRVTRVGRILRKTRIDELPQLWNVLKGEMSLVGPRPERPVFVEQLQQKIPYYGLRHIVKPGITGWAQINYGYGRNEADTVEKLQYDLFYIKNLSVVLDFLTLLETAKAVIEGRGL